MECTRKRIGDGRAVRKQCLHPSHMSITNRRAPLLSSGELKDLSDGSMQAVIVSTYRSITAPDTQCKVQQPIPERSAPERLVVDYDAVPEQGQRHGRREHQRGSVVDHPDLGGWRETQKCACSKGKFPPQGDSDLLFMILLRYDVELVYLTDYFVKVHLEELREVEIMLVLVS